MAAVVLPLLLLIGIECGLRLAKYGFDPHFFKPIDVGGRRVWVENDRFGYRFFPPALARTPAPVVVDPVKADGVYRIVVFGESAALGDPKPGYGFGRYLEVMLTEAYPGRKFEVVCVAMTAINSHAILPIARESARLNADLWIVSMGNNEMAGPFGANTVFGFQARRASFVRVLLTAQETRLGQWMLEIGRRWKGEATVADRWTGLKLFTGSEIAPGDARREVVYDNFRSNLEGIIRCGTDSGARVLVASVASNLKDCAPFASKHEGKNGGGGEFDGLVKQVSKAFGARDWASALAGCRKIIASYPGFAETHYVAGLCQEAMGDKTAARASFASARDLDALPFRTDTRLNRIAAEVAKARATEGVGFVDVETRLAEGAAEGGIPGLDLFYEHVHMTFEGNYRVARLLAESIAPMLERAWASGDAKVGGTTEWASQETCEQRLGLSDWTRHGAWEGMFYRILDAPFSNQVNHASHVRAVWSKVSEYRSKLEPGAVVDARFVHEEAVKRRPEDHWLRESYAEFLEATGQLPEALEQWQKARGLLPHHFLAHYQAGRIFGKLRRNGEAVIALNRALELRPDLAEAMLELGQIGMAEGKASEALAWYEKAEKLRPDDAKVHIQMAHLMAAKGDSKAAFDRLKRAVELKPSSWEARYLYGVELASQDRLAEAQRQFEAAVTLRPDHVLAHLNLGVSLAKQGRLAEAKRQFDETIRLDPQNAQAREFLDKLDSLKRR